MGVASILMAFVIIGAVVVGTLFAGNYYASKTIVADSYGNAPTQANNDTAVMITNGTSTGTNVESGLLLFIAVLLVFAIIAYFAFKRH